MISKFLCRLMRSADWPIVYDMTTKTTFLPMRVSKFEPFYKNGTYPNGPIFPYNISVSIKGTAISSHKSETVMLHNKSAIHDLKKTTKHDS